MRMAWVTTRHVDMALISSKLSGRFSASVAAKITHQAHCTPSLCLKPGLRGPQMIIQLVSHFFLYVLFNNAWFLECHASVTLKFLRFSASPPRFLSPIRERFISQTHECYNLLEKNYWRAKNRAGTPSSTS